MYLYQYPIITLLLFISGCLPYHKAIAGITPELGAGIIEFTSAQQPQITTQSLALNSHATLTISGMIAMVELIQTFTNNSNEWVEGRYLFPLPETAAVNAMEIRIGERIIKAKIKEKQEAQALYTAAKNAGKTSGLLEQQRANLFSQKIANIGPQENIQISLRYLQTVDYQDGHFSLRFPMTLTPRYIPGVPYQQSSNDDSVTIDTQGWGWAIPTTAVNDADEITPPIISNNSTETHTENPISLNITLDAGLPVASISSAYHSITITKALNQHHINLTQGTVSMDRDFVLSWQATPQTMPSAALFSETIHGDDYHLLMLMPPDTASPNEHPIPKDSIFIIDTSGSMGGTSITQAKAGLLFALQQLTSNDYFSIIEFNSNFSTLHPQSVAATPKNIRQAIAFVNQLEAGGGTEILPALTHALQQPTLESHLKQIIFITDGSVGNEDALLAQIKKQLHNSRLFTVGIGSAPNSYFMRKAAEFGRGSFTYIGDINEVDKKMQALFSKITAPVMRDIKIEDTQRRILDIFPNPLPDLYRGEPIIAVIHKDYEVEQLHISGNYKNRPWQQTLNFTNGKQHPGVAKLWARKKIEQLLDDKISGADVTVIKQQVIDLSIAHQLLSPYTSFVAVEERIRRAPTDTLQPSAVPNLLPQGQELQAIHYPQTATTLGLHQLIGLIALAIALGLQYVNKRGRRHA
jgi:Ca-activated chloride channel family protein